LQYQLILYTTLYQQGTDLQYNKTKNQKILPMGITESRIYKIVSVNPRIKENLPMRGGNIFVWLFVNPTPQKVLKSYLREGGGGLVGNSASSLKKTQFKPIYTKLSR